MIQRTPVQIEVHSDSSLPRWQHTLANAITDPLALLRQLDLDPALLAGAELGHRLFPLRVPEPYWRRIHPADPQDPLLLQVLPQLAETRAETGFTEDPLAEATFSQGDGIVRKYRSRALLLLTGACAINCRYCFRRHFPYDQNRLQPADWSRTLDILASDPDINEVIFSGGDPLAMNDRVLARLVRELEAIPHLRRLRIHTRLPVVIPRRIDAALLDWLSATRLQPVVVLHVNHPREIDGDVIEAVSALRRAGATLLNQSVLLRSVNDDAETLAALSERLFEAGVLPYYLHAFDPVAGAGHFAVTDDHGRMLMRDLLERLPGFLVPRLVRESPGASSKWPLDLGLA
ncbi:MAG: EF-P beta-lysylation protein EpmB [Alteromonadaceae bacterium]|nr:EF-P beta-lysylation protein EpmB [Alteromonadaceae bacterium]|tara:strand:- start:3791 stop:4828 length:1038 start_codon:yes stop_codon:yes gene_type:complete